MQARLRRVYEFGPFQLDAGERLLSKDGQPVPLTPKAFDTLLRLVENGGRLVEKEDLLRSVWPDSFVEENSLNRSIYVLRKTLGELSGQAKYIETVPKRGYRFVASVAEVETDEGDLILEKHTSAEIITEEVEEITDPGNSVFENSLAKLTATRTTGFLRRRRNALMVTGVGALIMLGVVYLWTAGKGGHAATHAKAKSIAVLPFKTLAPTAQNEYLGLGLADVLITSLSNIKDLNVRSTQSVLKYGESETDSVTAGRALKVDAVLEGSVQRIDDRIRVTVRLMNVHDEITLWGGKFDEPAGDVLKVQDSIAERVARALLSSFSSKERGDLTKRYTDNQEAYHLYIKGRYFWNKRSRQDYLKAIEYYQQAIEKDPNYALAYAGLADAYSLLANDDSSGLERPTQYEKARAAALKSLEIDESLSEAHTSLGWIRRTYEWNWLEAEKEFKRAIELSPNSANAHQWYALLLTTVGRSEEAIAEINRARELEPLSWVVEANSFAVFFRARRFDESIAQCRDALELEPLNTILRRNLVTLYVQKGMYDEAIAEINRVFPEKEGASLSALLARAYIGKGQKEKATKAITFLQQLATRQAGTWFHLATVYVDLNEKEKALGCLRKALELRDDRLVWLKLDPRFDSLHSDPRYVSLLSSMSLAD